MGDWYCPDCGTEYEHSLGGVQSNPDCCVHLLPADGCDCYECSETEYMEDGSIRNNLKYHTYGEECRHCGEEKTVYKDLGTKGKYVCPNQGEH